MGIINNMRDTGAFIQLNNEDRTSAGADFSFENKRYNFINPEDNLFFKDEPEKQDASIDEESYDMTEAQWNRYYKKIGLEAS